MGMTMERTCKTNPARLQELYFTGSGHTLQYVSVNLFFKNMNLLCLQTLHLSVASLIRTMTKPLHQQHAHTPLPLTLSTRETAVNTATTVTDTVAAPTQHQRLKHNTTAWHSPVRITRTQQAYSAVLAVASMASYPPEMCGTSDRHAGSEGCRKEERKERDRGGGGGENCDWLCCQHLPGK